MSCLWRRTAAAEADDDEDAGVVDAVLKAAHQTTTASTIFTWTLGSWATQQRRTVLRSDGFMVAGKRWCAKSRCS